jgi:hypothetical protein
MERVRESVKHVARGRVSVLILGAAGVGKGFLARTIHRLSERSGAFIPVRCDGASVEQLESELFGHERGARKGDSEARVGALEAADGGTVFLQEIGRLPLALQAALLRAIETGAVLPRGAKEPRRIDVRFISASEQVLTDAVAAGTLRSELVYRLGVLQLEIPPLRRRRDEIPKLVDTFIKDFCRQASRVPPPRVTPEAMEHLLRDPWPGNISELKQAIERALRLCDGPTISTEHLTVEMGAPFRGAVRDEVVPGPVFGGAPEPSLGEREHVIDALRRSQGVARVPASGQPTPSNPRSGLACCFCGQPAEVARKVVTGPGVLICDLCVEEAQRLTKEADDRQGEGPRSEAGSEADDGQTACAFCGKSKSAVRHLVGAEKDLICDQCLTLCDAILAEFFVGRWQVRKAITLRASYAPSAIDARNAEVRAELGRGNACRITILVDEGRGDAARLLLDRVKAALSDVGQFWEHAAEFPEAALALVAIPRPS